MPSAGRSCASGLFKSRSVICRLHTFPRPSNRRLRQNLHLEQPPYPSPANLKKLKDQKPWSSAWNLAGRALLELPASQSVGTASLATLRTAQYFRDSCTVLHKGKIAQLPGLPYNTNQLLPLRHIWVRSAILAQPNPLCASEGFPPEQQIRKDPRNGHLARPKTRSRRPPEFVFSTRPRKSSSGSGRPAHSYVFLSRPNVFAVVPGSE